MATTKKQSREKIYKAQMQELGIYKEAFDPEIKTLADLERDLSRAKKAWSATVPKGGKAKPSLLDPHYAVICRLRDHILTHREALGLTPKALRKLRGEPAVGGPSEPELITNRLDAIAQRVGAYEIPAAHSLEPEAAQAHAEAQRAAWDGLVPDLDTSADG